MFRDALTTGGGEGAKMKDFEIREISGQKVFVKEIRPTFFLFNDVFVYVCDEFLPIPDEDIMSFLDRKNDPIFPYPGAANEAVIVVTLLKSGRFCESPAVLGQLKEEAAIDDARRAYDEYKTWAGI